MRRVLSKTTNFGLLFGLADAGLVQYCEENDPPVYITIAEAKEIREKLLTKRPRLLKYIDELKTQALRDGYTTTILGMRRYFPPLLSSNSKDQKEALKAAVNHPIQGTAASIIKIAMVWIDKVIPGALRLQVHDELLLEIPMDQMENVTPLVVDLMEAAALKVLKFPVKVSYGIGVNWEESK